MSEKEVRAAIHRICDGLDARARARGVRGGLHGLLVPVLLGAGLVGSVACEGSIDSSTGLPDGGAGGLDGGATGGLGPVDAGGTDPGPTDAYGISIPPGGNGGTGGTGGSGGH
jgi:hypothetical protein